MRPIGRGAGEPLFREDAPEEPSDTVGILDWMNVHRSSGSDHTGQMPHGVYLDFDAPMIDGVSVATQMRTLADYLSSAEPPGIPPFLVTMKTGIPYVAGTSVPSVSSAFRMLECGLFVPADYRERQPMEFIGTWVELHDYLPTDAEGFFNWLATKYSAADLLTQLSILNRHATKTEQNAEDMSVFSQWLLPDWATRFKRSLSTRHGEVRLLARQPLLFAMKRVLALGNREPAPDIELPAGLAAILLSHAAASLIKINERSQNVVFGNVPEGALMDMVRLGAIGRDQTAIAQMSWYWGLWTESPSTVTNPQLPASPLELLSSVSGLDPAAIWALGLWMVGQTMRWSEGEPALLSVPRNESLQADIDRFVSTFSMSLEDAIANVKSSDDPWNYRFLEDRPIIRLPEGLLVPDVALLLDRFTSGLYWLVADTLTGRERDAWRSTYGRMVEATLKRQLCSIAPRLVGPGSAVIFDEDDIQATYGRRGFKPKAADIAIDYGDAWLVVEIVTRNLQVGTRIRGELACLESDIEFGVLDKVPQVAETVRLLLEDEERLTGRSAPVSRTIVPVVLIGEAFPLEPTGWGYIRSKLGGFEVLSDPRVRPLCLLDVDDFDYLEAMVEAGQSPVELLIGWKESDLHGVPFRKYARDKFPVPKLSSRVINAGDKMREAIKPRLT